MKLLKFGVLALALPLTACVSPDYQYTAAGATVGGITGAVVGHQIDDDAGRYVGGALGALIGGAIGNNADAIHNRPRYQQGYSGGYNQHGQPNHQQTGQNGYYDQPRNYQSSGYAPYPPRY